MGSLSSVLSGAVEQPCTAQKARPPHALLTQRLGQLLRAPVEMETTLCIQQRAWEALPKRQRPLLTQLIEHWRWCNTRPGCTARPIAHLHIRSNPASPLSQKHFCLRQEQ